MFKDGKDYIPLTNGEMEEESSKRTRYAGSTEAQLHYDNAPALGLVTVTIRSGVFELLLAS